MKSPSISNEFNESSFSCSVKSMFKHLLWMGAIMAVIGMASPAAAMAVPIDPFSMDFTGGVMEKTIGDFIVQSGYGAFEMLKMAFDGLIGLLSIGGDLITNTLSGNIMPTTYESYILSHDVGAAGHAVGSHEVAEHALTAGTDFDECLRSAYESDTLDIAFEDSEAAEMTVEEYMGESCGHEGH